VIFTFTVLSIVIGLSIYTAHQTVNGQTGNLTNIIQQKFTRNITGPTSGLNWEDVNLVRVVYESPTTILITGDLIQQLSVGGQDSIFNNGIWEAMDLLKNQYGFKLQNVMTTGAGTVDNPTVVYILMTR